MKSSANPTVLHEETKQLLPWYVNRTLSQEQHSLVEQHLQQCLICRRDWLDLQQLADKMGESVELDEAADASFRQIRQKLNPPLQIKQAKPLTSRRYQLAAMVSFGLAASILLLLLPSLPPLQHPVNGEDYRTLSVRQAEPSGKNLLKVVFVPGLPSQVTEELLAKIHGQRIDQANSAGAYTIQLNANSELNVDQALVLLRQHEEVLLAEPIQ